MKALLISVDFSTGKRAGGLNPRDKNLPCDALWQDIDAGKEMRIIVNGEVDKFRGIEGIEILEDESAIDFALKAFEKEEYAIHSEALLHHSIAHKKITLEDLSGDDEQRVHLKELHKRGALGIRKISRMPVSARKMADRHGAKD